MVVSDRISAYDHQQGVLVNVINVTDLAGSKVLIRRKSWAIESYPNSLLDNLAWVDHSAVDLRRHEHPGPQ